MPEKKMLFIDERNVHQGYRLKREVAMPTDVTDGPVIPNASAYGSVLQKQGEKIKMWYLSERKVRDLTKQNPREESMYAEAYAESIDGISWEMPELNLQNKHARFVECIPPAKNMFMSAGQTDASGFELCGRAGPEGFCVLDSEITPNPRARGRYTAMYLCSLGDGLTDGYPGKQTGGICFAHSDDGIHWTAYRENPVIKGWPDNDNCFYYDARLKKYVLYGRPNVFMDTDGEEANRFVGRTESDDLVHWSPYRTIFETDDRDADPFWYIDENERNNFWRRYYNRPDLIREKPAIRGRNRQFYGICAFPFEGIYLGFLQVYDILTGEGWVELVHSYDSLDWRRESVPVRFIGPRPGRWDAGLTLCTAGSPPLTIGDDFWIYYTGSEENHQQGELRAHSQRGIGVKKIGRERLVGYRASDITGELITAPFERPEKLSLIADLPDGVAAELIGADGEKAEGFSGGISENGELRFARPLSAFPYETVRLRLRYKNGTIWGVKTQQSGFNE